jgi:hypothetical protein
MQNINCSNQSRLASRAVIRDNRQSGKSSAGILAVSSRRAAAGI